MSTPGLQVGRFMFNLDCTTVAKNQHKTGLVRGKSQYVHRGPMSTHPNRMSID